MPQMFPMPMLILMVSLMILFFSGMVRVFWSSSSIGTPFHKSGFYNKHSQFNNQVW